MCHNSRIATWSHQVLLLTLSMLLCCGCVGHMHKENVPSPSVAEAREDESVGEVKLKEFYVSAGDEINITVHQHDELNRKIKIPPDGRFFYPVIGEIDTTHKSLREVRDIITKGLSEYKEHLLQPEDEIFVDVYRQNELSRKIVIPPDGRIFYPLVGEIDTTGKTIRDVREFVVKGLAQYKNVDLVPGDEIAVTVFRRDELNRKIIIPPDEHLFFPLVGEIDTHGKGLRELRKLVTDGLSKYFQNVQVEVNLTASSRPKLVVDPQVAVDIVKLTGHKRIHDPQVGIEVTAYGGQKLFVLGEVRSPGVFFSDGNTSVLEAISKAGGYTLDAKTSNILLVRSGSGKSKPELMVFNMENALNEGDMVSNFLLQKGDVIYVPRTFIANVDRFFNHLSTIISPLLALESGYYIGTQIKASTSTSAVIAP